MKVNQDLFINLGSFSKEEFRERMPTSSVNSWQRSVDKERDCEIFAIIYDFHDLATSLRAGLYIFEKPGQQNQLYVGNIVPVEIGQLSIDEYNSILKSFYDTILLPLSQGLNLDISLTNDELTASEYLSPTLFRMFNMFTISANRSTGISHPLDQERFINFLITSFNNNEIISSEKIIGFLIDDKWNEDAAVDLAIQYEFGLAIIKQLHG